MPIEFDSSEYHPLDHHWWEFDICNQWYGGTRNHLKLVWKFGSELTEFRAWWGKQTGCRFDVHTPLDFWRGRSILEVRTTPPDGTICQHCNKRL